MAKTSEKPADGLPAFEAGVQYDVQLNGPVKIGRVTLTPGKTQILEGAFAETVRDRIETARVHVDGLDG